MAMKITGEAKPIVAYPGKKPTTNVDNPMITIVIRNVYLRPTISPSRPNTSAPNGRTAKPAAKPSSVKIKAAVGLMPEKKLLLM